MKPTQINILDVVSLSKRVKQMTEINDHTRAQLLIAQFFNLEDYKEVFENIMSLNNRDGYLAEELLTYRNRKSKEMMNRINFLFGEEIYNIIK